MGYKLPLITPLFVPANKPERISKALASGADAVIVDLEDSIAPEEKQIARNNVSSLQLTSKTPLFIRINGTDTPWYRDDCEAVRSSCASGVMLSKTQSKLQIEQLATQIGSSLPIIGLIETAAAIVALDEICKAPSLTQLAFGSIDFAYDIGCHINGTNDALLYARSALVIHSKANGLSAPLDGVTTSFKNPEQVSADARYSKNLGFGGKLLIHPAQIAPARDGFLPSPAELAWAKNILAASQQAGGHAAQHEGHMIDKPVVMKALALIEMSKTAKVG